MAALIASSARIEQWIFTGGSASSSAIWVFLMPHRLIQRLALHPLGHQGRGGDGRAAAVGLERASWMMPSSPTLICSFITSPHAGAPTMPVPTLVALLERADVARVFVMIDTLSCMPFFLRLLRSAAASLLKYHVPPTAQYSDRRLPCTCPTAEKVRAAWRSCA